MKAVKLNQNKLGLSQNAQIIGAKLISQDGVNKIIIAVKEGGNRLIKSLTNKGGLFEEIIEEIHEAGTPLFVQIETIFNDLFNRLPRFIEQDGIRYELGRFSAPGKELDRVVYQVVNIEEAKGKLILIEVKAPAMIRANAEMHHKLEELGYL